MLGEAALGAANVWLELKVSGGWVCLSGRKDHGGAGASAIERYIRMQDRERGRDAEHALSDRSSHGRARRASRMQRKAKKALFAVAFLRVRAANSRAGARLRAGDAAKTMRAKASRPVFGVPGLYGVGNSSVLFAARVFRNAASWLTATTAPS